MIITSGIQAVTLAVHAGVNIRATVFSGALPASRPKGHQDFSDLICTLKHILAFQPHRKDDGNSVCVIGV